MELWLSFLCFLVMSAIQDHQNYVQVEDLTKLRSLQFLFQVFMLNGTYSDIFQDKLCPKDLIVISLIH